MNAQDSLLAFLEKLCQDGIFKYGFSTIVIENIEMLIFKIKESEALSLEELELIQLMLDYQLLDNPDDYKS